ncbi:MAG: beta-eliminating lyase-related protein [Nocardioidaceae bacterium]
MVPSAGSPCAPGQHPRGYADLAAIDDLIAPDLGPFLVRTTCVSVENTHNFAGGRVQPLETLTGLRQLADRHGVRVHLDGARIWNASIRHRRIPGSAWRCR